MTTTLSFEALDQKVEEWIEVTEKNERPGPVERWSFWGALLAAGATVLIAPVVGGPLGLHIAVAGLTLELSGFCISMALTLKRAWKHLSRQKRAFARELDTDFAGYRAYVDWLRRAPRAELEQRLHYVQVRKTTMRFRLGMFTGGIERLGILPVFVALYFQFKDWQWGHWPSLTGTNLVAGLLLWALAIGYAASWMIVRLMTRLDTYEALLSEAVKVRCDA